MGDVAIGDGESSETRNNAVAGILQQLTVFLFTRYSLVEWSGAFISTSLANITWKYLHSRADYYLIIGASRTAVPLLLCSVKELL